MEEGLSGLVGDEEECCAWCGADKCGADTRVDAAKSARGLEAAGGLEAGFERVDGVEGEIDGGAGNGACLKGRSVLV